MTANRSNPDSQHHSGTTLADVAVLDTWGKYAASIQRWAEIMGEPAPAPTDDQGRLSPELVRWMMGYEPGWVDGISRTGQLKSLGNAIVPAQAAAAWGALLGLSQPASQPASQPRLPTPTAQSYKESGICRDWGSDLTHAITCPHHGPQTATDPEFTDLADPTSGRQ
jgi:hypothetical protein